MSEDQPKTGDSDASELTGAAIQEALRRAVHSGGDEDGADVDDNRAASAPDPGTSGESPDRAPHGDAGLTPGEQPPV